LKHTDQEMKKILMLEQCIVNSVRT